MKDPWDERYIYLHEWLIFMVNVGTYAIPIDSMGKETINKSTAWVEKKCMNLWQHVTTKSAELFPWRVTLPETNIASENRPSRKETSLQTIHFQGLC